MEFISFPTIQAVDPKINDEKTIVGCHRVIAVLNIMKILVHHIMSITAVAVHERHDTVIWLQSNYTTLMVFPIEISHNLQIVNKFSEFSFLIQKNIGIGTAVRHDIKTHRLHHQRRNMNAHRHIIIQVHHLRTKHSKSHSANATDKIKPR